jgi:hypothetical protein
MQRLLHLLEFLPHLLRRTSFHITALIERLGNVIVEFCLGILGRLVKLVECLTLLVEGYVLCFSLNFEGRNVIPPNHARGCFALLIYILILHLILSGYPDEHRAWPYIGVDHRHWGLLARGLASLVKEWSTLSLILERGSIKKLLVGLAIRGVISSVNARELIGIISSGLDCW